MTTAHVTNWAQVVADRLVETARCVMLAQQIDAEQALECVLSNSCAGPLAIKRARDMLGIDDWREAP